MVDRRALRRHCERPRFRCPIAPRSVHASPSVRGATRAVGLDVSASDHGARRSTGMNSAHHEGAVPSYSRSSGTRHSRERRLMIAPIQSAAGTCPGRGEVRLWGDRSDNTRNRGLHAVRTNWHVVRMRAKRHCGGRTATPASMATVVVGPFVMARSSAGGAFRCRLRVRPRRHRLAPTGRFGRGSLRGRLSRRSACGCGTR